MTQNSGREIKNEMRVEPEIRSEKDRTTPPPPKKNPSRLGKPIIEIISGNFLTKENTLRQLPFLLFLMLMAMIYIANSYYAEKTVRDINRVNNELKELRSEFITSKSDLMFISKQSEVARAVLPLGIKENTVPPGKIVHTSPRKSESK